MEEQDSLEDTRLFPHLSSGRDVNFLVRSKASKIQTLSKTPTRKPGSCVKKLELLKEVELLQNVQVQRSLRTIMEGLNETRIGELESARSYLEENRCARRHENVVRIRKELQGSCKPRYRRFTHSELYKQTKIDFNSGNSTVTSHRTTMMALSGKEKIKNVFDDCSILSTFGPKRKSFSKKKEETLPAFATKTTTNSLPSLTSFSKKTNLRQESFNVSLPQIVKSFNSGKKISSESSFQYCLPVLDSESKFSIIKMARTLRQTRYNIQHQEQEKPEAKCHFSLEEKSIDLFGDNFDLLSPQYLAKEKNNDEGMKLLDSESFDDIDCDDFLHLKNRIVNLSPDPLILTHKNKDDNNGLKISKVQGLK